MMGLLFLGAILGFRNVCIIFIALWLLSLFGYKVL